MGLLKVDSADYTDKSGVDWEDRPQYEDPSIYSDFYSVAAKDTEGPSGAAEITYQANWSKWHGYYRKVAEVRAVVDKLASWTVGRGFEGKDAKRLMKLRGWGKDDGNSLVENMIRTFLNCGDSYAEIVRDRYSHLLNLKPLNPGSIKVVAGKNGRVIRYEQVAQIAGQKPIIFEPKDILHLSWNRIADEIHGIPFCEAVEDLIKMRNEAMKDLKVVFHRYIQPLIIVQFDSDDETEIATFKRKLAKAYEKMENLIIPKDSVEMERMSIPQYSNLDPLPWIKYLVRAFTTASGVPEVIMGWGEQTTEASAKIIYLAFQQTIERLQRYMEAQLKLQAGLAINFVFPASIEPELVSDEKKDGKINKKPNVDPKKHE